MQFRDWKSRISDHTTVRISSTRMIQHVTSTVEMGYRYGRILRFSSHFFLRCNSLSIGFQFLRGRCQILGIVEESRGSSFSRRWSFNNVSLRTHDIPCIVRHNFLCPDSHQFRGCHYDCQPTHNPPTVSRSNYLMILTRCGRCLLLDVPECRGTPGSSDVTAMVALQVRFSGNSSCCRGG